LDDLTIALSLCIGSAVAWVFALYAERGVYLLLWNVFFGVAGALLCALTLSWMTPKVHAVGMFTAVPLAAALAIVAGNAVRRGPLLRKNRDPQA
jgi:hypothetical protein